MSGGKVDNSLCSSYNGNHTGDMEITITGGEITGKLYGGNSYTSGSHTGNVSISISDTTVDSDLVAGAGPAWTEISACPSTTRKSPAPSAPNAAAASPWN